MKPLLRFWRDSVEEEVEREIAFHLDMTTHELMSQGMTENQARIEAERRFGDASRVDAECRQFGHERDRNVRRIELLDEIRHDVTFALRQLRRAPVFSAVAVLTLALGIGATAAIFSALDAVVLQPLPYEHAERIVVVNTIRADESSSPSVPDFLAYRSIKEFDHIAATVLGSGVAMKLTDTPEMVDAGRVTSDYFNVFGARAELGRTFFEGEDAPGQPAVAVISHRLWRTAFNADRAVVGRSVSLDGVPHIIIGVMPSSFDLTRGTEDIWLPLVLSPEQATKFTEHFINVYARLRPGVTLQRANAAATVAARSVAERMPDRTSPLKEWKAGVHSFMEDLTGDYRTLLFMMLGAVGFVLLIACSNVANLLLARGTVRSRELAIRTALGAGRKRLLRQLLTESAVLGLVGALLGLVLAFGLVKIILLVAPEDIPRLERAGVSWRVLGFTLGLGLLSSVIFGVFPALRAVGARLLPALREGGRGSAGGRDPLRAMLVAAEVALAIALLTASGLFIRSAWLVQRVDPGFNAKGVLTARLLLPESRYPDGASIVRAYEAIRDAAARIPGVASASIVSVTPMSGSSMKSSVIPENLPPGERAPSANMRLVSSNYFATMGMRIVAGRDVTPRDVATSPGVLVINELLARRLWPAADPRDALGKRLQALSPRTDPHFYEVVGVVSNLHDAGLNLPPEPEFYAPIAQTPQLIWPLIQRSLVIVLRGSNPGTPPESFVKPLRRAVVAVDPLLPVAETRPMESWLRNSLETARMSTVLLSTLGAIALLLAMAGIYGVVSYFVNQRTQEIGVRMALGASPGMIWSFVVRRGLTPVVVGLAAGMGLSLLTTTLIRQQLYGVGPRDPLTFITVSAVLMLVALVATYAPARRAMQLPPLVALSS